MKQKIPTYKKKIINKLLYGKYPYKITCDINNAHYLRSILAKKSVDYQNLGYFKIGIKKNSTLDKFLTLSWQYVQDPDVNTAVSYNCITFYIKNKSTYESMLSSLPYIYRVYEPEDDLSTEYLTTNQRKILCDNLPFKIYKYKITLKKMPIVRREMLYRQIDAYKNGEIRLPKGTKRYLSGESHRDHIGHYFYVVDEGIKLIMLLAGAEYIRRVEEYVLKSHINNEINQEQICQP